MTITNSDFADDEFKYLVEHIRAINIQGNLISNLARIRKYGEIGQYIVHSTLYHRYGEGNTEFLNELFKQAGIRKTAGYNAIKFYEKYVRPNAEDIDDFMRKIITFFKEGEAITWSQIEKVYLPEPTQKAKLNPIQEAIQKHLDVPIRCNHVWHEVCRFCGTEKAKD